MITESQAQQAIGATAYDSNGDKLGKIGQLFLDDQSGQPEFVTVQTGLFGTKESFVPVGDASFDGERVDLPYTKDTVKDAPNVDLDGGHLDESEEQRLFQHYGMNEAGAAGPTSGTAPADPSAPAEEPTDQTGHDTSGPTTDQAMTRSEESLRVGTTNQEAGRVRLRKYVTTETETHTVPVRKERAVLETEPITDGNVDAATGGPAISEEEHEVVLHEERPVVEKTVEPVERVRLGTETTTEDETVSDEVRKEHVETDGDLDDRR